jgi:uncharacterized protein (DUF433 family)
MGTRAVSLELPDEVRAAIEETGAQSGRDSSSIASEMLSEAVRMRRFPGIVFVDGPLGRTARLAGTDVDVYRIAATFNRKGGDWSRLCQAYQDLSEEQIRTAMAYADANRAEVDEQMEEDDRRAIEAVWAEYPITKPPWR